MKLPLGERDPQTQTGTAPPMMCRNCGHPVHNRYCPQCGQHFADHNHGLWQFIAEFLEEFAHFDSKFFRTLVPLCFKPGFLTKEWVAGKRVRYITPLKLYFTFSAIFFLLLSYHPDQIMGTTTGKHDLKSRVQSPTIIQIGDDDSDKKSAKGGKNSEDDPVTMWLNDKLGYLAKKNENAEAKRKELGERFLDRLPTANFVLLPLFALLFKMLYIRRSRFYVEHLVFALHYYSFCFLAATICLAMPRQLQIVNVAVGIWLFLYLPIAMVVNYQQGLIKSLIKCTIFGFCYLIFVGLTAFGLVVITAVQIRPDKPAVPAVQQPAAPIGPAILPKKT